MSRVDETNEAVEAWRSKLLEIGGFAQLSEGVIGVRAFQCGSLEPLLSTSFSVGSWFREKRQICWGTGFLISAWPATGEGVFAVRLEGRAGDDHPDSIQDVTTGRLWT